MAIFVKGGKIDDRDRLSPPEFAVFARLRALRKTRAEAEGLPSRAVVTNDPSAQTTPLNSTR